MNQILTSILQVYRRMKGLPNTENRKTDLSKQRIKKENKIVINNNFI